METSSGPGLLPILLGLLVVAVAAVFLARYLHQRSRRRNRQRPGAPTVDPELDRATRLRTVLPSDPATAPPPAAAAAAVGGEASDPPAAPTEATPAGSVAGESVAVARVSETRASEIVGERLARPRPGERTADDLVAEVIAAETAAQSGADAVALAALPVEALPAFGDNVVVARGAGPQLLLSVAREILDSRAEDEDADDLGDPLVRALDGGGACMSLPAGAGVEAALFVLDLLAHPPQGEPVTAEAWVTIRNEDVFLSVSEDEAAAAFDTAAAEAAANFPEDDPRYGQHLTAAVSNALGARGLPFGTRLYAYRPATRHQATAPAITLTDQHGDGYEAQWDSLDEPRLRRIDQVLRAWADLPEDVRDELGL